MKLILSSLATITVVMSLLVNAALAADPAAVATEAATNTVCPITGKPVDPAITAEYEGRKWSFAKEACKTKWLKAREDSLYQKLGGKAAMEAAIDAFYVKVLADDRVKHFFDDVSMDKQRRKQKEFLSAAFGGRAVLVAWVPSALGITALMTSHTKAASSRAMAICAFCRVLPRAASLRPRSWSRFWQRQEISMT